MTDNLREISAVPAFGETVFLGSHDSLTPADYSTLNEHVDQLQDKLRATVRLVEAGMQHQIELGCENEAAANGAAALALIADVLGYIHDARAALADQSAEG